jgi:hypothetical protein
MRCIYCQDFPSSVEHMPPRAMFRGSQRLSGLEFAACEKCNLATRAADAAAGFLCRISPTLAVDDQELNEAKKLMRTLDTLAPAVRSEVFRDSNPSKVWAKGREGLYGSMHRLELQGVVTATLMQVFGAKLGMALFREHIGRPLNLDGAVFVRYYFNAGLSREEARKTLQILPVFGELKMGKQASGRSFNYRYNSDDKGLIAALAAFSDNLFFRIFASDDQIYVDALNEGFDHFRIGVGQFSEIQKAWKPPPHPLTPARIPANGPFVRKERRAAIS